MIVTLSNLKSMDFTKNLRNPWFSLISVTLVMTSDPDSKEQPTKTRQNMKFRFKLSQMLWKNLFLAWNQKCAPVTKTSKSMKICSKLSQTLGEIPFLVWNQLSSSLKSRSREDHYIEYLEIHEFHQLPWFSRICAQLYSYSHCVQYTLCLGSAARDSY